MSETDQGAQTAYATGTVKDRHDNLLQRVIDNTVQSGFDVDAWHVMDQRDTRLIQDEIMGGARSSKFIYDFKIQSTTVRGISAVGARELATHYGKIKHRLVSSTRKIGKLFVFTTYAAPGIQPSMQTSVLPELEKEPDGYEAVCEVQDINSGNSMMAAKFESQFEWVGGKDNAQGRWREKSHFATIAQSKAQRNGILMVIPQAIQLEWMESMKGMTDTITGSLLAEKRDGVLRYGAAQGMAISREVLDTLLLDQIAGLSEAARTKNMGDFLASCIALGLIPPIPSKEPTRESVKAATATKVDRPAPTSGRGTRPDPRADAPAGPIRTSDGIPDGRWEDPPQTQAPVAHEAPAAPAASAPSGQGRHDNPVAAGAVALAIEAPVAFIGNPIAPTHIVYAAPLAAPFSEWLVDHEGEGIGEDPIDGAEAWARAYVVARDEIALENRGLFEAANAAYLANAKAASAEVARIVAPTRATAEPTLSMDLPEDPWVVPAPKSKARAAQQQYEEAFAALLEKATTDAEIARFTELNAPILEDETRVTASRRIKCKALLAAKRKPIAPQTPDSLAQSMILDMENFETVEALDAWKASDPGQRDWMLIQKSDAWLFSGLVAAEKIERDRLTAATQAPDLAPSREALELSTSGFIGKINSLTTGEGVKGLGAVQGNVIFSATLARHAPDLWRTMRRAVVEKLASFRVVS